MESWELNCEKRGFLLREAMCKASCKQLQANYFCKEHETGARL